MTKTEDENDKVEEFLKKTPIFPCFLISKDEGKIETIFDGFEKENIPIQKIQENSFIVTYQESDEDFHMIVDKKFSEDISFFGNSLKFDSYINRNEESSYSNKIFVGEYKLYSFNIKEEDLSFSKYYLDKFQQVANSSLSDEEKSKELETIFASTGYYIPKKIYIGGMLISHTNQFSKSNTMNSMNSLGFSINTNIQLDKSNFSSDVKSKFNEIYNSQSTQIIGGDHSAQNFEDWIRSINLNNSNVIECCNIITAYNILDNDLKKKLEIPIKLIDGKYSRRKNYLKYLNETKNKKLRKKQDYGNFNRGKCEEKNVSNEPRIKKESFSFFTPVVYFPPIYYEEFHKEFDNIIIGFEIHDNRGDGHNGTWTIKNEPLGSKEITIEFASGFLREQNYTLHFYLMETPN
jgi:hypothetical protein